MTESDGEAARGSGGLLDGAHFCAARQAAAKQLAVERRVSAPLNAWAKLYYDKIIPPIITCLILS
jgi:hypothetical protein